MNSLLLSTLAKVVIKQTILFQLYDYKCSVNKLCMKMSTGFEECTDFLWGKSNPLTIL